MLNGMTKYVLLLIAAAVVAVSGLLLSGDEPWTIQASDSGSPTNIEPQALPLAVATPGNKIYWSDAGFSQPGDSKVMRSNLDGSSIETVVTGQQSISDVGVDPAGGYIYWSANSGPHRSDLNGGGVTQLHTVASASIHVDVKNGKIYWGSPLQDKIQRANLDGSSPEDDYALFFPIPGDVAIDSLNSRLYWASVGDTQGIANDGKVLRSMSLAPPGGAGPRLNRGAEPDGNFEILVPSATSTITDLGDITGIALDISAGKVYWVDILRQNIQRSNLDGSSPEDLITTGLLAPYGIALDPINGHMYWSDRFAKNIGRANLDGTGQSIILSSLNDVWYITLDIDRCPTLTNFTPLDNDADWRCEDINGNGRQDFQDVVVLFKDMSVANVAANQFYFDFNGNNGVDFDDIVSLFEELATQVGVLP